MIIKPEAGPALDGASVVFTMPAGEPAIDTIDWSIFQDKQSTPRYSDSLGNNTRLEIVGHMVQHEIETDHIHAVGGKRQLHPIIEHKTAGRIAAKIPDIRCVDRSITTPFQMVGNIPRTTADIQQTLRFVEVKGQQT
ncbi:MAG: hypothetical protein HQL50_06705 [Magnetococcales bacterium]|nr:hypothetical protein [Magnetococcales bacterium]